MCFQLVRGRRSEGRCSSICKKDLRACRSPLMVALLIRLSYCGGAK